MSVFTAIIAAAFLVIGIAVGYLVRRFWAAKQFGTVEEKIRKDLAEAETKAKEIIVEAKDKAASLLVDLKNEEKERRKEIDALEAHLLRKEETLDKKSAEIAAETAKVRATEERTKAKEGELAEREKEVSATLEKIAGLSVAQAREEIVRQAKEDRSQDLAQSIQKIDREN